MSIQLKLARDGVALTSEEIDGNFEQIVAALTKMQTEIDALQQHVGISVAPIAAPPLPSVSEDVGAASPTPPAPEEQVPPPPPPAAAAPVSEVGSVTLKKYDAGTGLPEKAEEGEQALYENRLITYTTGAWKYADTDQIVTM